jgi:hypothetical protein
MLKQIKRDLNYVFYFLLFFFSGNLHNENKEEKKQVQMPNGS